MKKHGWIVFAAIFVFGLFVFTAGELRAEGSGIEHRIHLSGLIEVGGVWQDIDYRSGVARPAEENESDLCLTTVELAAEAELNEWVHVHALLLYEDPTFGEETHVEMEEAILTIGNTKEYPVYVSAGKMFVPFGALLTHFPDDPLVHAPLTLLLGETLEKAALVGVEYQGISVSAYAFNGDQDEFGEDNQIESWGCDANFSFDDEAGLDILVGGSYISNILDSDHLSDHLDEHWQALVDDGTVASTNDVGIKDYIDGAAAYLHVGFADFFVEAEYMTLLDEIDVRGTTAGATFERHKVHHDPEVWNVEVGYNLDWGKNLEIVLKYAGSDEAGYLGFPEKRWGICLNQELFEEVIVSLGYLYDDYESDDVYTKDDINYVRDTKDLVFAQIAIEF
ncbi:MAG: LbtU family siderophore porin [Deltaproteobacteria bacterium]|nr:LbtU family siderophore porin [Deltaproteobacteria bacterium]MBW1795734.1 LbtU family siderophore porin [Deltaproteobacteria bacterium]